MTPVCPACRAPVQLGSHSCWRCGLCIRPTCRQCGEPLMYGMTECWFCREPIEDPTQAADTSPVPVPRGRATTGPMPSAVAQRPLLATEAIQVPAASPALLAPPRPQRFSFAKVIFGGIVTAVLVVIGLLSIEMFMPRFTTTSPPSADIEEREFPQLGFAVGVPTGWTVREAKEAVSFLSPERTGGRVTRGYRVAMIETPYKKLRDELLEQRNRVEGYLSITRDQTSLSGADAVRFVFIGNDLRFEQWWIDRGKHMLRLEFFSRPADDESIEGNRRLARTFELS